MFDGRWRDAVDRSTRPVGTALHRRGITADVLTATGLISASATAVLVATGHLHWAIVALIVTGLHDLLDGPVAKAAGTASVRGAFFDSVTDRVADAVMMGGVSWYLIGRHEGHLAVLPLAVLGVTALVSYERAKAESLGLSAKGGLMERAERMILLGLALIDARFLVAMLWVMLVLISITAIARFIKVWNAASGKDEVIRRRLEAWREGRVGVDSRWRAWRESREGAPAGRPRREFSPVTGAPVGRWRARRQEALSSRSGRTMRERRRVSRSHVGLRGAFGTGSTRSGSSGGGSGRSTGSGTSGSGSAGGSGGAGSGSSS
jgi:CDP-diacylglycerol--glycerol-3-phosphate 3-phosphatidyltransferase